MNEKACLNLQKRILHSWCYLSNGSFNRCCFVALLKTICLERQLLNAYMHLTFAISDKDLIPSSYSDFHIFNGELTKLVFLGDAIIAYNNCVDTVLQILYFGLEFMPEFTSQKEYKCYLRNCKWSEFKKHLTFAAKIHPKHSHFFSEIENFYSTKCDKIRSLANALKHHGGIVSEHTQIPCPPGYTINLTNDTEGNTEIPSLQSIMNAIQTESNDVFSPKSVLPLVIDFEDTIALLNQMTSDIYDFTHYAFRYIGLYDATESNILTHKTFHPIISIRDVIETK